MVIRREGETKMAMLNGKLITLSTGLLTVYSDYKSNEIEKVLRLDKLNSVDTSQLEVMNGAILVFDYVLRRLIHVNDKFEVYYTQLFDINGKSNFTVSKIDDVRIIFANSLTFYEYNLEEKSLAVVPSIYVMKHNRPFRRVFTNLFNLTHSILYFNESSGMILYNFNSQDHKSRIGIYDQKNEKVLVEFSSPIEIEFFSCLPNQIFRDTPSKNKLVASGLLKDFILLCFEKVLYFIDFNGNVIKKNDISESSLHYSGICVLNINEFLISYTERENGKIITYIDNKIIA